MILEARFGSRRVGRLAESRKVPGRMLFEYDAQWRSAGMELSPVKLPLRNTPKVVWFDSQATLGLPGLFWDSLPDSWGMPLLRQRMRDGGRDPDSASALFFLAHVGSRGMGALEYSPDLFDDGEEEAIASLADLDRDALAVQKHGEKLSALEVSAILEAGSAVGGALPKALVYTDGESFSLAPVDGWSAWLVKLSTIPSNHKDSRQAGEVEAAFAELARAAGVAGNVRQ